MGKRFGQLGIGPDWVYTGTADRAFGERKPRDILRVKNGEFVLLPITDETRGHGTHSLPAIWGNYLAELLARSER
jgi:hypothetical protein